MLRKSTVLFALSFIVTAPLVACSTNSEGSAAPVRSVGESVYIQSCARCHGLGLEGNASTGTPAIDTVRLAGLSDQMIRLTIVNGKGQMPRFGGLSEPSITAVITYMRTRQ